MIIYKATNIKNKKVYIGMTSKSIAKRRAGHHYSAEKENSQLIFHRAIRKYGRDGFEWEILERLEDLETMAKREVFWISYYKSHGKFGYNMTDGGEGIFGHKMNESAIERTKSTKTKNNSFAKGSRVGTSKLEEKDILRIKSLIVDGLSNQEISDLFGVSRANISHIRLGKSWRHVGEDVSHIPSVKRLSNKNILDIKEMIKNGIEQEEIAIKYGVNRVTISNIKMNKIYSEVGEDVSLIKKPMERNGKLNEEKVREIKMLLKEKKLRQKDIAAIFNVSHSTINSISNNTTWKKVVI